MESEEVKTDDDVNESSNPISMFKHRERSVSPVRQLRDVKATPGSIGKLKISSEMRAKLELVTIAHQATTKPSNERPPELNDRAETGGVRKLEDNRRLMLQQQLSGRKWDTVEEVERITRRVSCDERTDLIKAVHQRPPVSDRLSCVLSIQSFQCLFCMCPPRLIRWIELVEVVTCLHPIRDRLSSKRLSSGHLLLQPLIIPCSNKNEKNLFITYRIVLT